MLESALKEQLKGIFAGLEANFTFDISVSSSHENKTELLELLGDVADCSDQDSNIFLYVIQRQENVVEVMNISLEFVSR